MAEVSSMAVFVDFENLALGFQNRHGRFDIRRVLQRLVEKGKIIVKKGVRRLEPLRRLQTPAARERASS